MGKMSCNDIREPNLRLEPNSCPVMDYENLVLGKEDNLKNEEDLKNEDILKNEDDLETQDNLKNEDNLKNRMTLKMKATKKIMTICYGCDDFLALLGLTS